MSQLEVTSQSQPNQVAAGSSVINNGIEIELSDAADSADTLNQRRIQQQRGLSHEVDQEMKEKKKEVPETNATMLELVPTKVDHDGDFIMTNASDETKLRESTRYNNPVIVATTSTLNMAAVATLFTLTPSSSSTSSALLPLATSLPHATSDFNSNTELYSVLMKGCPSQPVLHKLIRLIARPTHEWSQLERDPLHAARLFHPAPRAESTSNTAAGASNQIKSNKNVWLCKSLLRRLAADVSAFSSSPRVETTLDTDLTRTSTPSIDLKLLQKKLEVSSSDHLSQLDAVSGASDLYENGVRFIIQDLVVMIVSVVKVHPPSHAIHIETLKLADRFLHVRLPLLRKAVEIDSELQVCILCGSGSSDENDQLGLLMQCSGCGFWFHQTCANVPQLPSQLWYCSDCKALNPELAEITVKQEPPSEPHLYQQSMKATVLTSTPEDDSPMNRPSSLHVASFISGSNRKEVSSEPMIHEAVAKRLRSRKKTITASSSLGQSGCIQLAASAKSVHKSPKKLSKRKDAPDMSKKTNESPRKRTKLSEVKEAIPSSLAMASDDGGEQVEQDGVGMQISEDDGELLLATSTSMLSPPMTFAKSLRSSTTKLMSHFRAAIAHLFHYNRELKRDDGSNLFPIPLFDQPRLLYLFYFDNLLLLLSSTTDQLKSIDQIDLDGTRRRSFHTSFCVRAQRAWTMTTDQAIQWMRDFVEHLDQKSFVRGNWRQQMIAAHQVNNNPQLESHVTDEASPFHVSSSLSFPSVAAAQSIPIVAGVASSFSNSPSDRLLPPSITFTGSLRSSQYNFSAHLRAAMAHLHCHNEELKDSDGVNIFPLPLLNQAHVVYYFFFDNILHLMSKSPVVELKSLSDIDPDGKRKKNFNQSFGVRTYIGFSMNKEQAIEWLRQLVTHLDQKTFVRGNWRQQMISAHGKGVASNSRVSEHASPSPHTSSLSSFSVSRPVGVLRAPASLPFLISAQCIEYLSSAYSQWKSLPPSKDADRVVLIQYMCNLQRDLVKYGFQAASFDALNREIADSMSLQQPIRNVDGNSPQVDVDQHQLIHQLMTAYVHWRNLPLEQSADRLSLVQQIRQMQLDLIKQGVDASSFDAMNREIIGSATFITNQTDQSSQNPVTKTSAQ